MKKIAFVFVLFCFATSISSAQKWSANFNEALKEAASQNKPLLLVFSGSDWCGPCIKLDKNIWQSEEFKKFSNENYILYRADFPKKKANQLPEEIKKQNNELAEKYNQDGNYPLVVLLDGKGKVLGMTGYLNIDASAYIEKLKALDKR